MDKYTIQRAYPVDINPANEIEIVSDKLMYSEFFNLSGCQVMNMKNQSEIHQKCVLISELIKEIDELNK